MIFVWGVAKSYVCNSLDSGVQNERSTFLQAVAHCLLIESRKSLVYGFS